ncbi:MAG: ammonia-forming cytochrome c nitrite reductase subunit c552 [Planctomycetales bacterium]|nr:ammonia-forming cytochrome c nitrite reductase subunit c552 [Planctomycetales bacterium]
MTEQQQHSLKKLFGVSAVLAVVIVGVVVMLTGPGESIARAPRLTQHGGVIDWWDAIPPELKQACTPVGPNLGVGATSEVSTASAQSALEGAEEISATSNISLADYAGPDACAKCHPKQHAGWSKHPHRWMNSEANESTVLGDFGNRSLEYMGGQASFFREGDGFRMKLERGEVTRTYAITQNIGSRFYQYYVGLLLSGPEPAGDPAYTMDHVLPFGYWLDRGEWVPTVHVHWADRDGKRVDEEDLPSAKRHDPFAAPNSNFSFTAYYQCNGCHTTFPLGDLMVKIPEVIGKHAPLAMHFNAREYIEAAHPELPKLTEPAIDADGNPVPGSDNLDSIRQQIREWDARDHAAALGVTCESCHLGSKEHAEGKLKRPQFFPHSEHLFAYSDAPLEEVDGGRTHRNLSWACGRCHAGGRRLLAGGMATWNSTEFTDAMRGSCYSQMTCVDCHNPHEATGSQWTRTAAEDDQSCLRCHEKFQAPEALEAHTHHAPTSAGSHCMDCHMPRINEGLQDMVRTHMIFSPTQPQMLEANHPNACNQCHVDQSIDWTLDKLKQWYGREYDEAKIAKAYPDRSQSAAVGWTHSKDQSVRLIGIDSLSRAATAKESLAHLIDGLDDPYIINRQFTRVRIEKLLGIKLETLGYRYYMTEDERREPLKDVRAKLLEGP